MPLMGACPAASRAWRWRSMSRMSRAPCGGRRERAHLSFQKPFFLRFGTLPVLLCDRGCSVGLGEMQVGAVVEGSLNKVAIHLLGRRAPL